MYAFSENYVLPLSHDEVVHGKGSLWERMPGDAWNKAANVRALLAFMWAHPGKQLLFMGGEFGQAREWSEERSLDWDLLDNPLHRGIKTLVGDLNRVYKDTPALYTRDNTPEGFSWIDANDAAGNVLSFLRHGVDADGNPTVLACVANFSGGPRDDYRVGLPFTGRWREVLNTDAETYGGSGVGNLGAVEAEPVMWHGRPASAALRLPPQGVLWLAPERSVVDEVGPQRAADIGQAAPVAPFAPEVVGGTAPVEGGSAAPGTPAPDSPRGTAEMPELSSGDRTIVGGVDAAYAVDDTGEPPSAGQGTLPEQSLRPEPTPADRRSAGGTGEGDDTAAVLHPSATDVDAPHHAGGVPAAAVGLDDGQVDSAPSAAVSEDAPVVAPEVPGVEVSALGTRPEEAPADTAYEDAPPELERTPGAPDAVLDEPRSASETSERTVAVGGSPDAVPGPSATRSPLDDPDADTSTHQ
jgi:1,4-alpha-glucan branching enzyme